MAIEVRTVVVPEKTCTTHNLVCDCCGKKGDYDTWPRSAFENDEVTVRIVSKESYPGGDTTVEGEAWDFCPQCFEEKVRPLLVTLAQPREVENSW